MGPEGEEEKVPKDWALGPSHIWGKKKKKREGIFKADVKP